jgi:dTDP-4-amino-4,6-dideoxygalactose transaminase
MNIPFFSFTGMHPELKAEVMEAFEKFFDSNWYVLGKEVKAFEEEYARYSDVDHCIGVANGLDALHIALKALNVSAGDEVIVPSNTYIATWLAVSYVGAKVVPVEPDAHTYNLDPDRLEEAINKNTKVIMPVHLYGQACEMDKIMAIAKRHGIEVVEDNAQAQGARSSGQLTGSFGAINGVSFYPGKNLGALGDAGALTTNNVDLAHQAKVIRNYGSQKKYFNERIGINSRLDESHAAILRIKLRYLDKWNQQRAEIAHAYQQLLGDMEEIQLPVIAETSTSVWHQFIILTPDRDEVMAYLKELGIGTLIHYPIPPHLQEAYSSLAFKPGDFPIAERISRSAISLPIYPGLSEEEIQYICQSLRNYFIRRRSGISVVK